ncbi:MAG: metabolite traffic protein EboE [Pseudomonadota bacterium]
MLLPGGQALTYCLNIHPTQSWAEARAALTGPVAAVKKAVCPNAPFVVGLRFSAETMGELADPDARAELAQVIRENDYLPLTMNGFPYGPFHGTRVKEDVYLPDWRSEERVAYTRELAELMAELNPESSLISLSTVPGAFRPNGKGSEADMARNYLKAVAHLIELEARTGRCVALAIEPEPCCFLETIEETITYFQNHLFSDGASFRLADMTGLSADDAAEALPRHLGLCYDVCHAAVEFENPADSIEALRDAGIPVHKLQLSSAVRVVAGSPEMRDVLARYDEPTYLHQLIEQGPDGLSRFADLGEALGGGATDGREWRVHFHVPVFLEKLPDFETTQAFLSEIIALHRAEPISTHLEIETYTWDVLPQGLRSGAVEDAVVRELNWVIGELGR